MSQPSAIARAMPARFNIPPESSPGISDSAYAHLDLVQEHARGQVLLREREVGELIERKAHVLEHVQRAEQGAALVHHPELALQLRLLVRAGGHDAAPIDEDVARHRLVQADDVLHQARLAAARSAQHHHDLAALHVERGVVEEHARAITHAQVAHADGRQRGAG